MDNVERLNQFFEAENKRDWETFRSYLHPEVMWFLHPAVSHMPVAGQEEYMDRISAGYQSSDATFTCERMEVSQSGNRIIAFLRNSHGGRSVDIFDFEDGLIRWEHEYLLD